MAKGLNVGVSSNEFSCATITQQSPNMDYAGIEPDEESCYKLLYVACHPGCCGDIQRCIDLGVEKKKKTRMKHVSPETCVRLNRGADTTVA